MTGEQSEFKNEKKKKFVTKIHQEPGLSQMVKNFHNCHIFVIIISCTDQMEKREGGEAQLGITSYQLPVTSNISASDQPSELNPLSPPSK